MTPEELVSRGIYLFPCRPDTKRPRIKRWQELSSIDIKDIQTWKAKWPDSFWGVDAEKSNLFIIDDDRGKKPEAERSLLGLELEHGMLPSTFTVRTPSGGLHYYFSGLGKSTVEELGAGLDTRSIGGLVIAPTGNGYEVVNDIPLSPAPSWLITLAGEPRLRSAKETTPLIPLDNDIAIQLAISYLADAPPSIEGDGGDKHLLDVAHRLKDFGISQELIPELLSDHWNDRCIPPWDYDDLIKKAYNSYQYGTNPPGCDNPAAVFTIFADDAISPSNAGSSLFIDAFELLNRDLTIDYLINHLIETPATGLMFGESTAGKSFLGLALALSVATNTPWLGNDVMKPGPVFYLAGEGQKGIPRRLKAWLKHHGIDLPPDRLKISRHRLELDAKSAEKIRLEIEEMAKKYGKPSLIIIDTLARHLPGSSDENSAKDIGAFINAVDYLKDALRCVMLIIHHSGKKALEVGRGSSALKAAMDFEIQVKPGMVTFTKQKDGELPEPFGFDLLSVDIDLGISSAVPVESSLDPVMRTVKLSKQERLAFDCLRMVVSAKGKNEVKISDWRDDFKANLTGNNESTKRSAFSRCVAKLQQVAAIVVEGDIVALNVGSNDD